MFVTPGTLHVARCRTRPAHHQKTITGGCAVAPVIYRATAAGNSGGSFSSAAATDRGWERSHEEIGIVSSRDQRSWGSRKVSVTVGHESCGVGHGWRPASLGPSNPKAIRGKRKARVHLAGGGGPGALRAQIPLFCPVGEWDRPGYEHLVLTRFSKKSFASKPRGLGRLDLTGHRRSRRTCGQGVVSGRRKPRWILGSLVSDRPARPRGWAG